MCRYKSYLIMMIGQAEKMSHDEDRNKESEREREDGRNKRERRMDGYTEVIIHTDKLPALS